MLVFSRRGSRISEVIKQVGKKMSYKALLRKINVQFFAICNTIKYQLSCIFNHLLSDYISTHGLVLIEIILLSSKH